MTTVRHVAPTRMLGNTLTLLLTLIIMCTTSGQGQLTSTTLTRTVTTTQRPITSITRTIVATSGVVTPSTTRTQTTIRTNVNSSITTLSRVSSTVPTTTQRLNANTNTRPVEVTSVQSTPLTTSIPAILVSQDVFIVCSNQYSFVFGPATTTGATTAARTMTAVTTRAVTGTTRQVTSSRITTSTTRGAVTTRAATGTTMRATSSVSSTSTPTAAVTSLVRPEVLYAAALVVPIARAANISNASRVANVSVFGESITNRLVIQLTILDGTMPSTAEAIRNLRRLIQLTNITRRKRQSSASSSSLIDVYNQTLVPVLIVSWTATGPCPNESCRNGGVCRGRTDGNLTCDCPTNDTQPLCDVLPTNVTVEPWSCRQDVKCIVPAIVVPIAGVLLIIVAGVVVFLVVRKCRRRKKNGELNSAPSVHVKDGGSTKKERKTKQIDRRTITSLNAAAFENAIYNSTENERPDFMPLQPLEAPTPSFEVNTLTKAESRSRFKKAKRESKATNGRATARHSQGDASTMRKSNVMVVGEDEGSTTSLNRDSGVTPHEYGSVHEYGSPREVDGSGTISSGSASTFDTPTDGDVHGVNTEIMY